MKPMMELKKKFGGKVVLLARHNPPQFNRCNANVMLYKLAGGEGRVCYGSMGWKTKRGEDYYEWEVYE
jgi:hypothetical protein